MKSARKTKQRNNNIVFGWECEKINLISDINMRSIYSPQEFLIFLNTSNAILHNFWRQKFPQKLKLFNRTEIRMSDITPIRILRWSRRLNISW